MTNQPEEKQIELQIGSAQIINARGKVFSIMFVCGACSRRSVFTNRLNEQTMRCAVCSHNEFEIEVYPSQRTPNDELRAACDRIVKVGCVYESHITTDCLEVLSSATKSEKDLVVEKMCYVCQLKHALDGAGSEG